MDWVWDPSSQLNSFSRAVGCHASFCYTCCQEARLDRLVVAKNHRLLLRVLDYRFSIDVTKESFDGKEKGSDHRSWIRGGSHREISTEKWGKIVLVSRSNDADTDPSGRFPQREVNSRCLRERYRGPRRLQQSMERNSHNIGVLLKLLGSF